MNRSLPLRGLVFGDVRPFPKVQDPVEVGRDGE